MFSSDSTQPAQHPARGAIPGAADPVLAQPKPQESASPLVTAAYSLLREAWGLVHDHGLLVALELQRAGRNLTRMVFGGVIAAVLMVTAWLALVAALMFWLIESDVRWAQAFLAVGLIHSVVSAALLVWIRSLGRVALFSALLRQFRPVDEKRGEGP